METCSVDQCTPHLPHTSSYPPSIISHSAHRNNGSNKCVITSTFSKALCYSDILLPSKNTTYIYHQLDNLSKFWQHLSAVKSHHQAKIEQSLGTMKVCTLWNPISFTIVGIVNDMGSHRVHTFIVPRLCSILAR
jgi:hypothetical protein